MEEANVNKKKTPQTHTATELFAIGPGISSDDATITGIRLPTCLQVLRCMMYHCNEAAHCERPGSLGAIPRCTTAKVVLRQITSFYEKANIPMITERKSCEKIIKLLNDCNKLRSLDKRRRDTPAAQCKVEQMQSKLASTFQLWPKNADSLIKNAEELAFLNSMRSDRAASFGAFDKALAQKISRRSRRNAAELQRMKPARSDIEVTSQRVSPEVVTDDSNSESESDGSAFEEDMEARCVNLPQQQIKPGTAVLIPPDVLRHPNLVSLATRLKMTPTQQAAFTQGMITECGGSVSNVAASYATADRSRRKTISEIATKIHNDWEPPELCTLLWD